MLLKKLSLAIREFFLSAILGRIKPPPESLELDPRAVPWMRIAVGDLKTDWREIPGSRHNPKIVECFRLCDYPNVKDDETAWCGVYVGSRLILSGYEPPKLCAWARNYSNPDYGIDLKSPQWGCIVNVERGAPGGSSHVGFVVGWDDEHVRILGGNQSNNVTDSLIVPRSQVLSYKWPIPKTRKI